MNESEQVKCRLSLVITEKESLKILGVRRAQHRRVSLK